MSEPGGLSNSIPSSAANPTISFWSSLNRRAPRPKLGEPVSPFIGTSKILPPRRARFSKRQTVKSVFSPSLSAVWSPPMPPPTINTSQLNGVGPFRGGSGAKRTSRQPATAKVHTIASKASFTWQRRRIDEIHVTNELLVRTLRKSGISDSRTLDHLAFSLVKTNHLAWKYSRSMRRGQLASFKTKLPRVALREDACFKWVVRTRD